ncbi:3-oxoadipate enol-lactonase [Rhizobium rhizogenes]|uniref:3-oxoadipate enol-lactonase n=1 Tax=Rhizobium rhizogenes TaxID=359 RepID=UPI001572D001|nr:3-oxoadipate enol-lactonase [Rhizobium rhizogenes]NTI78725.1 3-oxoadipate enol-lactonase [Rhizobium rhizogenes]
MPYLDLSTHRLHYRVELREGGMAARPWLVFCNSLGTDLRMWDQQVAELGQYFRILRYDRRGHGSSTAPPEPYALSDLGQDVIALLNAFEIGRAHFCGLSIGGLTGQWLGVHAPDRLLKLVVCATAPRIGTAGGWASRIDDVRKNGLKPIREATRERWFSPAYAESNPLLVSDVLDRFETTSPTGYIGCCAALAGADLASDLAGIDVPLLAISGADDPVCPPSDLRKIASAVPHGRHVSLPGRHIFSIESPLQFNGAVREFLQAQAC